MFRSKWEPNEVDTCIPGSFIRTQPMMDCSRRLSKSVACFWTAEKTSASSILAGVAERAATPGLWTSLCVINNYKENLTGTSGQWKECLERMLNFVCNPNICCGDLVGLGRGCMFDICTLGSRMFFSSCFVLVPVDLYPLGNKNELQGRIS